MTTGELQQLYESMFDKFNSEISRQDARYMWIIGILITLIITVLGFYSYQQWKLSDKQIKKMEGDFKRDFNIDELNTKLSDAEKTLSDSSKLLSDLQHSLKTSENKNLELSAALLESVPIYSSDYALMMSNRLVTFKNGLITMITSKNVEKQTLDSVLVLLSNGLHSAIQSKTNLGIKFNTNIVSVRNSINTAVGQVAMPLTNKNLKMFKDTSEKYLMFANSQKVIK